MSSPSCFGPEINIDNIMNFRFIHNHGEDYKSPSQLANNCTWSSYHYADLFHLLTMLNEDFRFINKIWPHGVD